MCILALYWAVPPQRAGATALALSLPIIIMDTVRLFSRRWNKALTWLFWPFMRENERNRLAGLSFMLAGVTIIILLFNRHVVLLSLMFLGVADPTASFFGIRYGKDKLIGEKSLQGSLAAFVSCFLLSLGYFYVMDLMRERLFIVCLLAGLSGAIGELVPVGKLDDNLVFPVVSGALLSLLFYLFGGF
jgi:dolichol kinase